MERKRPSGMLIASLVNLFYIFSQFKEEKNVMRVLVVIDCDESLRKKASYTLDTFFQVLGLQFAFSEPDRVSVADFVVWYGRVRPSIPTRMVFIEAREETVLFFREKRSFKAANGRKFQFFREESVGLFYDEEFERNPAQLSSGDDRYRHIHVDLVASAFYFLSCWQEVTSMDRDRHERFPASASLQHQLGFFHIPVVNQYVEIFKAEIEKVLGRSLERRPRFHNKEFAVCITHDIDYIRKWTLGIIYRELVQYLLLGRHDAVNSRRLFRFFSFLRAISARHDPYIASIEKIVAIEKQFRVHATYFFKAGVSSKHDTSYRLRDGYVSKLLTDLESHGHEIGLHPSYNAYLNSARTKAEKKNLDDALGRESVGVRQHFLRFRAPDTWRVQAETGFIHDSTLGFSDHEGFRAGICHPFRPYDIEHDAVVNLWEIPLLAMDGTFQSYRNKSAEESLEIIKTLIRTVKKYRGVGVLLFHNTCYDEMDFAYWGTVFENTLNFALQEGAFVGTAEEILNSYHKSSNPPSRQ